MATITKAVNKGIADAKRYQYWKSSEKADDGTAIATGDVFQIEASLGRPAKSFIIETASLTVLTIRLNSKVVTYPILEASRFYAVPQLDLENPIVRYDTSMEVIDIGADEVWRLDKILPICDIEIVSFTAGSFEIFVS